MKKLNTGIVYPKLRIILISLCLAYIFILPVLSFSKIGGLVFVASNIWIFVVVDILVFSIFIYAWFVLSPGKKIVLFLRKFRNENTNQLFEKAVRSKGAKDYRLVTLDDESFVPFGATVFKILASLLVILFSLSIVYTLYDNYQIWQERFNDFLSIGNESSFNLYYKPLIIFGLTPILIGLTTFVVWAYGRIVSMKMHVSTDDQIRHMSTMVKSLKGKGFDSDLLRPRSSIITVIDDSSNEGSYTDEEKYDRWQKVVSELCALADIVLLDFTSNTDPLIWELDYTKLNVPDKLIVTVPDDLDDQMLSELTNRGITPVSYAGSSDSDAKNLLVQIKHKLNDINQTNLFEVILSGMAAISIAAIYYFHVLPDEDSDNEVIVGDFYKENVSNDQEKLPCIMAIQYVDIKILKYETNTVNCNDENNANNIFDDFDEVESELMTSFNEFNSEFKNPDTNISRLKSKYNNLKKVCFGDVDYKLTSLDEMRDNYRAHMLSQPPTNCNVVKNEVIHSDNVDYDATHVGYINNRIFDQASDIHIYNGNDKDFINKLFIDLKFKRNISNIYGSDFFKSGVDLSEKINNKIDEGYSDIFVDQKSISLTKKSTIHNEYLTIGWGIGDNKDFIDFFYSIEGGYGESIVLQSNEYYDLKSEYIRQYGDPLSYDEVMHASNLYYSNDNSNTRNLIKKKTSLAQCDKYSGTALYGNCVQIMSDAQRSSLEQYDNTYSVVATFKPCANIEYESNKYGGCLSEMLGISYVEQGLDGSALYNDSCIAWVNNGEFLSLCAFDGHYKALKTTIRTKFID